MGINCGDLLESVQWPAVDPERASMKISDGSTPYAGYLENTGEPTVDEVKGRKAS